jgi:hypothetical protein
VVKRGILPRFDKWIFKPIVVRKYQADSDGAKETGTTHAVHQERGQTKVIDENNAIYGYIKTVTDHGDIKEFVPRHINQRIVGDYLQSVGGNYELKVKTTDRLDNGQSNPQNLVHREYLADGTTRLRINENVTQGKSTYDNKISPDGTVETYIKAGGGTSSDYNLKIKYSPDGTVELESKKDINIKLTGNATVEATGDVSVKGKNVNVEATTAAEVKAPSVTVTGGKLTINGTVAPSGSGPLCGIPFCLITGAPQTGAVATGT